MSRPLSTIEHLIDGCIVYALKLEGDVDEASLHAAIARVQAKHPALRATVQARGAGLRYVDDSAGPIRLRAVPRRGDEDYRREADLELETPFASGRPQLRLVWLYGVGRHDLLFAASHRICDGMSLLIVARETLKALHDETPLRPYASLTASDIVGDYRPDRPRRRRWIARLISLALRLLPPMPAPVNREHHLEWSAGPVLSSALRQRCKREQVSVHAALLVALDEALATALGREQVPAWIESPMDGRRGRVPVLADDRLFYGGGGLKFRTGQDQHGDYWERVRGAHDSMQTQIEHESRDIPSRYHFCELIRPPAASQLNALIRFGNALGLKGSWNRITLSNLGQIDLVDEDAPFRLEDFRLYVHSHSVHALGLLVHALHGQIRFYFMGDRSCIEFDRMEALRDALMAVLAAQVERAHAAPAPAVRVEDATCVG